MTRARILAEARASAQRRRSMCIPDRVRKPEPEPDAGKSNEQEPEEEKPDHA